VWTIALLTITTAPIGLLVGVPATHGTLGVLADATGIAATSTLLAAHTGISGGWRPRRRPCTSSWCSRADLARSCCSTR